VAVISSREYLPGVRALAWGLVAALAAGGCGGDDGSDAALKGDPVPLARFVARADRICRDAQDAAAVTLGSMQQKFGQDGTLTGDEAMIINRKGAELVRPMVQELAALPPPAGREDEANTYLRATEDTLTGLDDAVAAYEKGDKAAINDALERNRERAQDSVEAAKAVGLKVCGTEFNR
jgi:hypothetical protein